MGRLNSALLLSLIVLSVSFVVVSKPAVAVEQTRIYVFPTPIDAEPGEKFVVEIKVKFAVDVYAWEFKMVWNASVLNYLNATEGNFLISLQDIPTYWVNPVVYQNESDVYNSVLLGCTRLGTGIMGVGGSGVLATIAFEVQAKGETSLDLVDSKLRDSFPNPIVHTAVDGLFSNVAGFPRPDFSFTPAKANINETVTFNASNSSDINPDGSIVAYTWDFGDGANVSEADPVTYHSYREGGIYDVILTVTDNDNWNKSISKPLKVRFLFDVMIVEVKESVESANIGDILTITVKLSNEGSNDLADLSVSAYYGTTKIGSSQTVSLVVDQTKTLTFTWDTKDLPAGNYRIKADVSAVENEPEEARSDNTKLGGTVLLNEPPQIPWMLYGGIIAVVAIVVVVAVFFLMRRRGSSGKKP